MPTEQCVFLILYIHSIYGIFYMYITKYGCVFLKLGESTYVAMDLIPILPIMLSIHYIVSRAHNAGSGVINRKLPLTSVSGRIWALYTY